MHACMPYMHATWSTVLFSIEYFICADQVIYGISVELVWLGASILIGAICATYTAMHVLYLGYICMYSRALHVLCLPLNVNACNL